MTRSLPKSAARDVYLALTQLHYRLHGEFAALFRRHGITQAQFNVLRVLVTGPRDGMRCQPIGDRLLNRVPDVTRLIDRMEAAGLVERSRSSSDRRAVRVRITANGRRKCESLYEPVSELHRSQFRHMSGSSLKELHRHLRAALDGS